VQERKVARRKAGGKSAKRMPREAESEPDNAQAKARELTRVKGKLERGEEGSGLPNAPTLGFYIS